VRPSTPLLLSSSSAALVVPADVSWVRSPSRKLTSTESLYRNTPQSALQYDLSAKPKIKDSVVVIAGPDKGRIGVVLGIDGEKSIVKLSTKELKVIDMTKIAKQQ
jgi:hypothetical protein